MMRRMIRVVSVVLVLLLGAAGAAAQDRAVYRCPGNLYTDQFSAKEAAALGCKTLDGSPITIVQGVRKPVASSGASTPGSREARIDPADQRARDTDARRILGAELRKEEDKLAELRKDYNGGAPERRGDERNYARYQERVAELKAALDRKEADIAALKRELAKLPAP